MSKTLTPDEFRQSFPEINSAKYPDAAVKARLVLAGKFFSVERFDDPDVRNHLMGLYTAHYLTAHGSAASGGNGSNGGSMGIVSAKSVDGVSVSYDTSSGQEEGAGFWNMTTYGREPYQLLRVFGAGAVQL